MPVVWRLKWPRGWWGQHRAAQQRKHPSILDVLFAGYHYRVFTMKSCVSVDLAPYMPLAQAHLFCVSPNKS
eukprot:6214270-Pleurochrysis_carterae.AAC.3